MLNKHLFKILAIFVVILGVGLLSFTLVSRYHKNGGTSASAGQRR